MEIMRRWRWCPCSISRKKQLQKSRPLPKSTDLRQKSQALLGFFIISPLQIRLFPVVAVPTFARIFPLQ